ncbi:MAG TPA: helix-turn-helix transcriptional regulator [Terriglobia bacterium]|nr:helix-turn-helix transcriptional regulator [Terriglobia bacterium]
MSIKQTDLPGIGERLRQAREAAGLSQGQVSRILKMHRPTITEIENETRKLTAGELREFGHLYKVSVEWLVDEPVDQNQKLKMAARKLSALKDKDLDAVIRIIESLPRQGHGSGRT